MIHPPETMPAPEPLVVVGATDLETAQALADTRRDRPDLPVVAVFAEPEIAAVFRDLEGVRAVAWLPVLAGQVTQACPPSPLGCVSPPPIVVGDGPLATHIVTALADGWSEPGQPFTVHCLGAQAAWAQEADEASGPHVRLLWSELPPRPMPVVHRIRALLAEWAAPPKKHATPAGPAVIVALGEPVEAVGIAAAVAARVSMARVAVVVPDAEVWPPLPGVEVFSTAAARAAAVHTRTDAESLLKERLLEDCAWVAAPEPAVTRPVEPVFAPVDEPMRLMRQIEALVAAQPELLQAGHLVIGEETEPVILTPAELTAMTAVILRAVGAPATDGTLLTALELAARLPALLGRAGMRCRRPEGYAPLLTHEHVELLAPLVHLAYQDISAQTGNATGSALAYEMWDSVTEFYRASNRAVLPGAAVSHAAVGLDWRASEDPTVLALTDAEQARLAELEHRRWAIHQRRNGANDHAWMRPWDGPDGVRVTDGAKEYDLHIARQVIRFLADAGVEVCRAAPPPAQDSDRSLASSR